MSFVSFHRLARLKIVHQNIEIRVDYSESFQIIPFGIDRESAESERKVKLTQISIEIHDNHTHLFFKSKIFTSFESI